MVFWGCQILLAIVFSSTAAWGNGLYFTLPEVELALPANLPSSTPLLQLQALFSNNSLAHSATYTIVAEPVGHEGLFTVDSTSGVVTYRAGGPDMRLEVEARSGSDVARMTINATAMPAMSLADCDARAQELCFWKNAKYQVFENRNQTVLGPLGPSYLQALCPNRTLSYQLLRRGSVFASVGAARGQWRLSSNRGLERDVKGGGELSLQLACSVAGAVTQRVRRQITLRILDENDNPPRPHHQDVFDIYLDAPFITRGSRLDASNLIFRDRDLQTAASAYEVRLEGDENRLLSAECKTRDDTGREETHTLVYCSLMAAKSGALPTQAPYIVRLVVRDRGMLPNFGQSHGVLTIRLHADNTSYVAPPRALPLTEGQLPRSKRLARRSERSALTARYPSHVTVHRGASPYARVAQPKGEMINVMANETEGGSKCAPKCAPKGALKGGHAIYTMTSDPPDEAFEITRLGGIVYVDNVMVLRNSTYENITLTVKWREVNGTVGFARVFVTLLNTTSEHCDASWSSVSDWPHCADQIGPTKCGEVCGLGTTASYGRWGCQWRHKRNITINNGPTKYYPTCTPNVTYCPDRICDPLEDKIPLLCPQDCTTKQVKFGFKPQGNHSWTRGIFSGSGVCTCDQRAECVCMKSEVKQMKTSTALPIEVNTTSLHNVSAKKATDQHVCGTDCLITGSLGVSLLVIVFFFCFAWRYSKAAKERRDRKCVGSAASLSGIPSDYVARSQQGSQMLNFESAVTTTTSPSQRKMPDPKWEFPRGQLVIEQTLGEGEFGRVLRARATNIAGQPGMTTVAVKTLKEDASSVEMADLLSEYQLLKEVSHPNVVKLLGACTIPTSQPVYLIIEYAQHGSLRNYLRKSRHLESDGRIPCSFDSASTSSVSGSASREVEESITSPCTPRDILSFAWQISKGMSYLSDIKLVHRDLAARNVLVATGGVCKVSDFGLTRDVYEDDAYLKRSKGRVPVKWMALESLADHMYTSKSDVWSFGVLMWELVTLGASPYPGVAVHNLFHLLRAGYRMERPENCSSQLYDVMNGCWQEDPSTRPSFHDLTLIFERMLEDGVEYLDLNPRIVHNRTYFTSQIESTPLWTNPLLFNNNNNNSSSARGADKTDALTTILEETSAVQYSTISRSETRQLLQSMDCLAAQEDSTIIPETLQLIQNTSRRSPKTKQACASSESIQLLPKTVKLVEIQDVPDEEVGVGESESHSYQNDEEKAKEASRNGAYLSPIKSLRRTQNVEGYSYVAMAEGQGEEDRSQDLVASSKKEKLSSPAKVTRF